MGTATYTVHLYGIAPYLGAETLLQGPGRLGIDFGRGNVQASGQAFTMIIGGAALADWQATATLGGSGSFAGDFYLGGHKGGWNGALYGPKALELGAVFEAPGQFSGFMIGTSKPATTSSSAADMNTLERDARFLAFFVESRTAPAGSGSFSFSASGPRMGEVNFRRKNDPDPNLRQYFIQPPGSFGQYFNAEHLVAAKSDDRFDVYEKEFTNGVEELRLSVPGQRNPDIQLTYLRFGHWQRNLGDASATVAREYTVFGFPSNSYEIPIAGTASYTGLIHGQAWTKEGERLYELGGTAAFQFDFTQASFSGSMSPVGVRVGSGEQGLFGTFTFGDAKRTGAALQANILSSSNAAVGDLLGRLFGPAGVELGAGFNIKLPDPAAPSGIPAVAMGGVIVARQD